MIDKPPVRKPSERVSGISSFVPSGRFEQKIAYLEQLRQIDRKMFDGQEEINARINRVCDSIEHDISIVVGLDLAKENDAMMYSHQCIGCGHRERNNSKMIDGLTCPKCGDSLVPKRYLPDALVR